MTPHTSSLVLVMGLPGTGKTTLSKKVSLALELPLISRDEIKLLIMDNVGWKDREWSKKVGKASYDILDYVLGEQLKSGTSCIIESDFDPVFANKKFQEWQARFGFNCVQVICTAKGEVLLKRWQERAASDLRHPSITEGQEGLRDLEEAIKAGERQALDLKGTIIRVVTDDFAVVNVDAVIQEIKDSL